MCIDKDYAAADIPILEPKVPEDSSVEQKMRGDVNQGIKLAMARSTDPEDTRQPETPIALINAGKRIEQYYIARFGVLPEDHLLVKYVESLNAKFPKIKVQFRILPGWDEVNAFALPNGVVLISRGMIELCEHEEELQAVLGHERVHIQKHFRAVAKDATPKSAMDELLEKAGHSRFKEYEADLRSVVDEMDANGINPYGAKSFFTRLSEREGTERDIAHGSSFDRQLNISTVARLIDLKEMSQELTSWKVDKNFGIGVCDAEVYAAENPSEQSEPGAFINEGKTRLKALGGDVLLFGGSCESRFLDAAEKDSDVNNVSTNLNLQFAGSAIGIILKNTEKFVADRFPRAPGKTKKRLTALFLNAVGQINIFNQDMTHEGIHELAGDFFDGLEKREDFDELLNICIPENLEKAGLICDADFEDWLQNIFTHACDCGLFGEGDEFRVKEYAAFCRQWADQCGRIATERGTSRVSLEKTAKIMYDSAKTSIDVEFGDSPVLKTLEREIENVFPASRAKVNINITLPRERETVKKQNSPEGFFVLLLEEAPSDDPAVFVEYMEKKTKEFIERFPMASLKEFIVWIRGLTKAYPQTHKEWSALPEEKQLQFDRELLSIMNFAARVAKHMETDGITLLACTVARNAFLNCDYAFKARVPNKKMDWKNFSLLSSEEIMKLDFEEFCRGLKLLFLPEYREEYLGVTWRTDEFIDIEDDLGSSDINLDVLICEKLKEVADSKEAFLVRLEDLRMCFPPGFFNDFLKKKVDAGWLYSMFHELFERQNLNPQESEEDRRFLLEISDFIPDLLRVSRLQSVLLSAQLEQEQEFEAGFKTLFVDEPTKHYGTIQMRDGWLEGRSYAAAEIDRVSETFARSIEELHTDKNVLRALGQFGLMDILERHAIGKEKLFMYLLNTGESDEVLKRFLLENKQCDDPERLATEMVNIDLRLASLWSLSDEAKLALLRILLFGKSGIFRTAGSRKKFLEMFLGDEIERDGANMDLYDFMKSCIPVVAETGDMEFFYFAFLPILHRRIARPPKTPADWSKILKDYKRSKKHSFSVKETMKKYNLHYSDYNDLDGPETDYLEDVDMSHSRPHFYLEPDDFRYVSEKLDCMIAVGSATAPEEAKKLNPLQFVLEIAKSLGAVGVRFLQVLGGYLDLDPRYEAEFSEVYDRIRGQSIISAYRLIKREWPEFAETIKTVHPRVGGGSLMSVYEIETHEGRPQVIKVLNPNVRYHMNMTAGLVQDIIERLAERDSSPNYDAALLALQTIREWIDHDLDLENFLEDDKKFMEKNQWWSVEGNQYTIGVPKTEGPENAYFMREEYIEGKNLTQWDELVAEGNDMRAIVSLLCRNYMAQISSGLVHADVHIGNIRVTPDKICYILDRAGYLKFTEEELGLLWIFLGGDKSAITEAVCRYAAQHNPEVAEGKIMQVIEDALANEPLSPQDVIMALHRNKLKIPFHITLLMKNLKVLDGLAKKAGFSGMKEAVS